MSPTSNAAPGETRPLIILDGMSLAFRAYFALPDTLKTSAGVTTNAVHGFTSMVLNLVKDHRPIGLAVAFDLPGGTFRDEIVDDYKGGRNETPADLPPQFDMIRHVMESLAIPVVSAEGFEADDVLATLASEARDRGHPVIIVTGDRDSYQLVEDPYIRVLYNRRGVSDYALYDEAGIQERTGVLPPKYPLLAALRGDPSDNLPGVPGVGEKTAAKLINEYIWTLCRPNSDRTWPTTSSGCGSTPRSFRWCATCRSTSMSMIWCWGDGTTRELGRCSQNSRCEGRGPGSNRP